MDILQAQIQAMKAKRAAPYQRKGDIQREQQEAYLAEQKKAEEIRAQKEQSKLEQIREVYKEPACASNQENHDTENDNQEEEKKDEAAVKKEKN